MKIGILLSQVRKEEKLLFEEFERREVPGLSPFLVRPWKMKEFYIHDPHGNLLKFGCGEW